MASEGLSPLAEDGGACLGQRPLPEDRLPGHHLLLGAEAEREETEPRRGRPAVARHFREAGHSAPRTEAAGQRGRRRDLRQCLGGDGLQGETGEGGSDLLLVFGSGAGLPGTGQKVHRLGSSLHRQLLRDFELGGLFGRLVLLYLEGCTAPKFDKNQLHAAVVELVAFDNAEIKYSTVQNWYAGDEEGRGGIYNFVTKRGKCAGNNSKISWTQVETGSAITWKYPSCILQGDNSIGEFYSVALTNHAQQADTGTKMIHLGKNTRSTIISKGIAASKPNNSHRGHEK